MRNLNTAILIVACMGACFFSADSANAQDASEHLKPLARLVGTWRTPANRGETTEGNNSYNVFTLGINGHTLDSKTYTVQEDVETLAYEGRQYWHAGEQTLKLMEVSSNGTLFEGTLTAANDTLEYAWKAYAGERVLEFKQTITFVGDDRYDFVAYGKTEGGWQKVVEATFIRDEPTGGGE